MILHVPEISGDYFRVAQHLRRRTIGNTAAKVEHGDAVSNLLDEAHVVIDYKNGEPVSLKPLQKLDELVFFDSIQASARFIEEQQLGAAGEGPRDLSESPVPIGEALHCLLAEFRKTDEIEGSKGMLLHSG